MSRKIVIEDECVGCPDGCRGCGLNHVSREICLCDECGHESDTMYSYEGQDYCEDCIIPILKTSLEDKSVDEILEMFGLNDPELIRDYYGLSISELRSELRSMSADKILDTFDLGDYDVLHAFEESGMTEIIR